ncbi:hypothetical protein EYC84_005451 [Monilinia fructicola]|uniref:Uncharacterized protein n=1 Tax=Monilinia fructicola TaxID=38448 RepID=A0A5M9K1A0_MONFR|nr:hypothetical protein EYC84_005451 [Monilinia fructicola]
MWLAKMSHSTPFQLSFFQGYHEDLFQVKSDIPGKPSNSIFDLKLARFPSTLITTPAKSHFTPASMMQNFPICPSMVWCLYAALCPFQDGVRKKRSKCKMPYAICKCHMM